LSRKKEGSQKIFSGDYQGGAYGRGCHLRNIRLTILRPITMLTNRFSILSGLPEATTSMFRTFRAAPKRRVLIFISELSPSVYGITSFIKNQNTKPSFPA